MFAINTFIDSVQTGKKYFVSSFVTDAELKKELNAFVDTQTAFVKQVVKTTELVATTTAQKLQSLYTTGKID